MNHIRCESCQGRKQILSLGGMMKDCTACRGIGWLDAANVSVAEIQDIPKPKRKYNRKTKVNPEPILQCDQ